MNPRTQDLAISLRSRVVRPDDHAVLLACLTDSEESKDKYTQLTSDGFARTRVFRTFAMHFGANEPENASRAKSVLAPGFVGLSEVRAQVFQLAACSWRCWYCYVDSALLRGDPSRGKFVSASELVDIYERQDPRAHMVDLSGGQPDLVPEWPLWVLKEFDKKKDSTAPTVRSEDNLSNEWLWQYLSAGEIAYLSHHPKYVRVGCIKGFDEESFQFNTGAPREMYSLQFEVIRRLLRSGFALYLHATFTSNRLPPALDRAMNLLMDRLQDIHPCLPLRTMPLRIRDTPAMSSRGRNLQTPLVQEVQNEAAAHWDKVLRERFSPELLATPVGEINLDLG